MGWLFMYKGTDKKKLVELLMTNPFSSGCSLIEYRVVGNNLWYLYSEPSGKKTIGLYLLASGGKDSGWGYIGMSEGAGPSQLNCPLSFIEKADPPESDHAREWREKVLVSRKEKKEKDKALLPNTVVRIYGTDYKLLYQMSRSTKWSVQELATGKFFTVKKSILDKDAEIMEEKKEVPVVMATEEADVIQAEMFA